ncbi:Dicer-like protein 1 [Thecaphora frezii]
MLKRARVGATNANGSDASLEPSHDAIQDRRRKRLKKIAQRVLSRTAVVLPTKSAGKTAEDLNNVRSYQRDLFERAKRQNLVVCLPTGSGKTLVAALLLQHVWQAELASFPKSLRPSTDNPEAGSLDPKPSCSPAGNGQTTSLIGPPRRGRVSFFLVNLVPLVHQQANVIAACSDLRVGKLYGELKADILERNVCIDTWRAPEWDQLLRAYDVVVATAQCLLDALAHAYVRITDINLLIFDEAHHALNSHPYARIMLYYRLADRRKRPKILGLTASPIFSTGDYAQASALLEQTLDAAIATAPQQSQVDLQSIVNRPEIFVAEYDPLDECAFAPTPLSALMQKECEKLSDDFAKSVWPTIEYSLANHGPLMTDLIWHGSTQGFHARAQRWKDRTRKHSAKHALVDVDCTWAAEAQTLLVKELRASQLCSNAELNRAMVSLVRKQPALPETFGIGPHNCSSKVLRLVEVLRCFGSTPSARSAFCGIIFVQRRQTAASLAELLRRIPELDYLKPEWLIGHDDSNGPAMDWQEQVEVLDRFRRRAPTNLLVATSVAEEGIDIQAANVVIRFDLFARHSSFLQSKGRARSKDSRFVILAERNNWHHYRLIASAMLVEMGRGDWLVKLAEKTETQPLPEKEEDELGVEHFLDEPTTGARLYAQDAARIVTHYVAYLRTEEASANIKPEFKILVQVLDNARKYQCHLRLPANSKVREVMTELWSTKKGAKRMAALEACRQLRQLEALDEHLMPRQPYGRKWDAAKADKAKAALKPPTRAPLRMLHFGIKGFQGWKTMPPLAHAVSGPEYNTRADHFWGFATLLPLERLGQDRYRSLFLVTSQPLPSTALIRLHMEDGLVDLGQVEPAVPIELDPGQFEAAQRFTAILFSWIMRKQQRIDARSVFLILPATSSHIDPAPLAVEGRGIDWASARNVASGLIRNASDIPAEEMLDTMVIDRRDLITPGSFAVEGIRCDLTPFSAPPSGSKEAEQGSVSYYDAFCKMRARFSRAEIPAPPSDQALLSVRLMSRWRNNLLPFAADGKERNPASRLIIPSFFQTHPLSTSVARSGLLLPSLLYRYDDLLLTRHCHASLFSSLLLPEDLLLQALTPPSRISGYNYETLEFYGDTVLKLLAACQVFTTRLHETEGELHVASRDILVNSRLEEHAMRLKLWRWVRFSDKWMRRSAFSIPGWQDEDKDEDEGEDRDPVERSRYAAALERASRGQALGLATSSDETSTDDSQDGSDLVAARRIKRPTHHRIDVGPNTPLNDRDIVGCKTLSDIVEAILGAALFHGGLPCTLAAARALSILPPHVTSAASFAAQLSALSQTAAVAEDWRSRVDLSALAHLQTLFAYEFRKPHLALEAFTHPSLLASVLPSYQRLEYLGDALLDFFVVEKLRREHPDLDQGELTALKSNMVSNATLAALCEVLDLSAYISSHSAVLAEAMATYVDAVRRRRVAEEERYDREGAAAASQYWWTVAYPKAVADVVESSLGAVLVDAGFEVEPAQRVFDRTYWPFLKKWCSRSMAAIANIKVLARLMVQDRGGRCRRWGLEVVFLSLREVYSSFQLDGRDGKDDKSVGKGGEQMEVDNDDSEAGDEVKTVARCRIWSHGRVVAEATERIRSARGWCVLVEAQREAELPENRCGHGQGDSHDEGHEEGGGGRVSMATLNDVIRTMRWARPFGVSASFGWIQARHPPKLEDVGRCWCVDVAEGGVEAEEEEEEKEE